MADLHWWCMITQRKKIAYACSASRWVIAPGSLLAAADRSGFQIQWFEVKDIHMAGGARKVVAGPRRLASRNILSLPCCNDARHHEPQGHIFLEGSSQPSALCRGCGSGLGQAEPAIAFRLLLNLACKIAVLELQVFRTCVCAVFVRNA